MLSTIENVGNSIACNSEKFPLRLISDVRIKWTEFFSGLHDDRTNDDIAYAKNPPIRGLCVCVCYGIYTFVQNGVFYVYARRAHTSILQYTGTDTYG